MERLRLIKENIENDQLHIEKYVKELTTVCEDVFRATGAMLEQEHLRFINMFVATGTGGGAGGGGAKFAKGVMEHRVIQNLKAANGDTSVFRQWHQNFTISLGHSMSSTRRYFTSRLGRWMWARSWTWR